MSENTENSELLPIGTKIRFTERLSGPPTGDHPAFLFARKGQTGKIVGHHPRGEWRYSVKTDSWPHASFSASDTEFEVLC